MWTQFLHLLAMMPLMALPNTITNGIRRGLMKPGEYSIDEKFDSVCGILMYAWLAWAVTHWMWHFNII